MRFYECPHCKTPKVLPMNGHICPNCKKPLENSSSFCEIEMEHVSAHGPDPPKGSDSKTTSPVPAEIRSLGLKNDKEDNPIPDSKSDAPSCERCEQPYLGKHIIAAYVPYPCSVEGRAGKSPKQREGDILGDESVWLKKPSSVTYDKIKVDGYDRVRILSAEGKWGISHILIPTKPIFLCDKCVRAIHWRTFGIRIAAGMGWGLSAIVFYLVYVGSDRLGRNMDQKSFLGTILYCLGGLACLVILGAGFYAVASLIKGLWQFGRMFFLVLAGESYTFGRIAASWHRWGDLDKVYLGSEMRRNQ